MNVPSQLEEPITLRLNNRLSVRIYKDSRPKCLEIAPLQKGLVLLHDNKELIEEGVGLGVPVVKYKDKTYFSSSAEVTVQDSGSSTVIKKTFVLDAVSRKRLGKNSYVNDSLYSLIHAFFEKAYLNNRTLNPFFSGLMAFRHIIKIRTDFLKVKSRGTAEVTYRCHPTVIRVSVDFSNLVLDGCEEILILNEQGATFFREYFDSDGTVLTGNQMGAWAAVTAEEASLLNSEGGLAFTLRRIQGASLSRGWEKIKNRFSWAGLSYSLEQQNRRTFEYCVDLRRVIR